MADAASAPLAIDLFCGLGGWTEGLLAEGWYVVGFDIERHDYGTGGYPAQLVLQDVMTLYGGQFKDASLIVASPPCQGYSYRAMPWSRAKALPPPDNSLFEACFRIQREAMVAAARFIPMVVENVRGAQKWVGRARWNYGSYYLWGDVPALMPIITKRRMKFPADCGPRMWSDREVVRSNDRNASAFHLAGATKTHDLVQKRDGHGHTRHLTNQREHDGLKVPGIKLSQVGFNVAAAQRYRMDTEGLKQGGDWFNADQPSISRKAASATIAKIPFPLARHIASVWKP